VTDKPASPAVVRAVQILDLLAASPNPVSFSQLVNELGLPKSSVHGLCLTLLKMNLVQKHDSGHFTLGGHVMSWANAFLARIDITQEFFAAWDEMRVMPEETITLSVLDGNDVVYIACRNGSRPLGVTFRTGMRLPAIYTATGKAMLMTYPEGTVEKIVETGWPKPLTPLAPHNLTMLHEELSDAKEYGYSIDAGGVREGMHCFGAPVFDSMHKEAVAGVAVSFLTSEVDGPMQQKAGLAMRRLADRLSERLGHIRS
jgi:DNA-binding IclR family transcriptional regulator